MTDAAAGMFAGLSSFDGLWHAFKRAARGKRSQGEVASFEFQLERNLLDLERELNDRTYVPGPYDSFHIRDPKPRLVSAAPFRDRVVHHALVTAIEPLFERGFIADSYANRTGKGTHRALARAQALARRYPYVLQCDVRQYFPSVDHALLSGILARKIRDPGVEWLARRILESGEGVLNEQYDMVYFPGDDLFAVNRPRGLPIGNLTSQFWGNVYLDGLDQLVQRRLGCPGYVRYVDDFLLFAPSKRCLWAWKDAVREHLAGLRLTLHERRSTVYPTAAGIPFLGFVVRPSHRRLRRRNGVAFARRFQALQRLRSEGRVQAEDILQRVAGWVAHARHGDTYRLRRSLLGTTPAETGA